MNAEADGNSFDNRPAGDARASASGADVGGLKVELAAQKDQYLRLAADFDNFRKRTRRETERSAAAQKKAFTRDLLRVIDNLDRALTSHKSTSTEQLREGVQMTLQQL